METLREDKFAKKAPAHTERRGCYYTTIPLRLSTEFWQSVTEYFRVYIFSMMPKENVFLNPLLFVAMLLMLPQTSYCYLQF